MFQREARNRVWKKRGLEWRRGLKRMRKLRNLTRLKGVDKAHWTVYRHAKPIWFRSALDWLWIKL